jgi:hypothetical protein
MLTPQQLATILAAGTPRDARFEPRRARRFPYQGEIQIRLHDQDELEMVSVLDLSSRGLRISCSHELRRNMTFVAFFPRFAGFELSVLCTVAHCQPHANRMYTIGAEFTCVLQESSSDPNSQSRIRDAILNSTDQ